MAARRRRTDKAVVNEEFQLPEHIIQHIQSYLDGKQAAQTMVLSKSWCNAWLTRPTLDFDQRNFDFDRLDFQVKHGFESLMKRILRAKDEFESFMKKTMKRYEDLSLKIDSFRLFMSDAAGYDSYSLANELICKAMKIGVSDFNFQTRPLAFVLPKEVLEAESLVRLSVKGFKIDPPVERKILCLGLRYLRLENVYIEEDTIQDIISSCPLIEDLQLSSCLCSVNVQGSIKKPKVLSFGVPLLEHEKQDVGLVVDNRRKVLEFCKLKSLLLERIDLDSSFFYDFSLKFPLLEDLTIYCCNFHKGIQISSPSLKFINLEMPRLLQAEFDFPRIRKFTYCGANIPSVSFRSISSQCLSVISIYPGCSYLQRTRFLDLKRFLLKLSPSRISLNLHHFIELSMENDIDYVEGVELLPKPVVENLTFSMYLPSIEHPALLDGLFLSFHPKFITLKWSIASLSDYKDLEIFKKLIRQVCTCFCIPEQQTVLCFRNLEEANLEETKNVVCPYDTLTKWQKIWKTWLDAPPRPVYRVGDSVYVKLQTT